MFIYCPLSPGVWVANFKTVFFKKGKTTKTCKIMLLTFVSEIQFPYRTTLTQCDKQSSNFQLQKIRE